MSEENEDKLPIEVEISGVIENTPDLSTSEKLASFLASGNSLSSKEEVPQIANIQTDSRGYLALYARSQLERIEKLTTYINDMEDKMMEDVNSYDPDQFMRAMGILQKSLSASLKLIKTVSNDDLYLNLFYNETNNIVNNPSVQVNSFGGEGLSREGRDKIRGILSKVLSEDNEGEDIK